MHFSKNNRKNFASARDKRLPPVALSLSQIRVIPLFPTVDTTHKENQFLPRRLRLPERKLRTIGKLGGFVCRSSSRGGTFAIKWLYVYVTLHRGLKGERESWCIYIHVMQRVHS